MKKFNIFLILLTIITVNACSSTPEVKPEIVPAIEVKKTPRHSLGVIGEVEPIYMLPMKTPFAARVDTGATVSSIDADNIKPFERDGEKWVAFDLINRKNGEKYHFEKKVQKITEIKRLYVSEKRYVVEMNIRLGKEVLSNVRFNLAQRDKFDYQALIGRNILNGRALVDTSLSNTLN